jgi:hypothetical protein
MNSLYDSKIAQGVHDDATRAKVLQSSSGLLGRLKWATEDRRRFFSAIEDLTKANDLLENLLRIKPPEDDTFLARSQNNDDSTHDSIIPIRASLEKLHRDLLVANPNGREVEFCLKLALDNRDKESYADYVDIVFDPNSVVYSLQAHLKSKHRTDNKSYYFLAETAIADDTGVPELNNIAAAVNTIDPDANPVFQCLGNALSQNRSRTKLRIYQDKTSHWTKTHTLAKALQDQSFQDICFTNITFSWDCLWHSHTLCCHSRSREKQSSLRHQTTSVTIRFQTNPQNRTQKGVIPMQHQKPKTMIPEPIDQTRKIDAVYLIPPSKKAFKSFKVLISISASAHGR